MLNNREARANQQYTDYQQEASQHIRDVVQDCPYSLLGAIDSDVMHVDGMECERNGFGKY